MARIAGGQHGVITRTQLLEIGVSSAGVGRRVANGVVFREYPTVYRVGHRAPSVPARYAAAVLACGDGAALAGPAAAHLYGLLRGDPPAPEVVTPAHRRVRGVIVHRARTLDRRDVRTWQGIRVTTIARTLVDLAATLSLDALARTHHEARIRFHVAPAAIEAVIARRPNATGIGGLRAVVHGDTPSCSAAWNVASAASCASTASRYRSPTARRARTSSTAAGPDHRLTVELDSFRFHNSRAVWEQDRQREREARARGDRHRRFTWRDVFEDRTYLLTQLGRLLPRR